jgi:hypothetical protein
VAADLQLRLALPKATLPSHQARISNVRDRPTRTKPQLQKIIQGAPLRGREGAGNDPVQGSI